MKEKIIGIPGWKVGENSYGVTSTYLEFVQLFGLAKIIMPWEEKAEIDMLIIPGGMDTNPANYGQLPGYFTTNPDVFKDLFIKERLQNYIDADIPIIGICLGMQQLNVFFGGKLHQNVLSYPFFHEQSPGRWQKGHKVTIINNKISGEKQEFEVNSHHHQAVLTSTIAKELIIETVSTQNKQIVESFVHREKKILGIQWHPKFFGAC